MCSGYRMYGGKQPSSPGAIGVRLLHSGREVRISDVACRQSRPHVVGCGRAGAKPVGVEAEAGEHAAKLLVGLEHRIKPSFNSIEQLLLLAGDLIQTSRDQLLHARA